MADKLLRDPLYNYIAIDRMRDGWLIEPIWHGNYSYVEPLEMMPENKANFRKMLRDFMDRYRFNRELFPAMDKVNP